MTKKQLLYFIAFCFLLTLLAVFILKPQQLQRQFRASLSFEDRRYPFIYTNIQEKEIVRAKLEKNISKATYSSFYQQSPLLHISESSVGIRIHEGISEVGVKPTQGLYFLPTGISELKSPLEPHDSQKKVYFAEAQNFHSDYNNLYKIKPIPTASSLIKNKVTGFMCLPTLPEKGITNPFFIKYRNTPLDPEIQATPIHERAKNYIDIVKKQASKYKLTPSLILAIIHVESGFNPKAVSAKNAHGLMQIVTATAGMDVDKYLGKQEPLSPNILHEPEINIKYGTTYLYLLSSRHFHGIHDPLAREYCIIAAYNGGARRVLELFGSTETEAFETINKMTAKEVYTTIQTHFPSSETRDFLQKVVSAKMQYYLVNDS